MRRKSRWWRLTRICWWPLCTSTRVTVATCRRRTWRRSCTHWACISPELRCCFCAVFHIYFLLGKVPVPSFGTLDSSSNLLIIMLMYFLKSVLTCSFISMGNMKRNIWVDLTVFIGKNRIFQILNCILTELFVLTAVFF